MIDKEGADHVIAWCNLEIARKTEVYEDLTRPRNDPYANGEYSGYMHAMRDVKSQMERIKWSIEGRNVRQAAAPPDTSYLDRLMELCSNRKSEMRKSARIANLNEGLRKTDLAEK